MTPSGRRLLTACLFFSGAASLVMEVAWSRSLSLVLGNSHQAVATVVASMMTGLCAGSLLAVRRLPRVERLARAYGALEAGIGAYGALTPLIFHLLPLVLGPLHGLPPAVFALVRFLIVFTILLPPSAGMGATLPVVTAALARSAGKADFNPGSIGGRLYGLNTLGALAGTLAGGFLLLPGAGLLASTLCGAATSLGVGLIALRTFRDEAPRAPAPVPARAETRRKPAAVPPAAPVPGGAFWILPLYAVSGALAMIYEVTWTRVLTAIAGSSVYSFTLILSAVLAGIGIGSLLLSTRFAGAIDPARGFVGGQLFLSAVAFLSLWGLARFPDQMLAAAMQYAGDPGAFLARQFLLFGLIVLPPGLLLGALFPFASRLLQRLERESGTEVGRVYAWNTAGSIAGSLLAGFLLVELLGSERTLALACVGSACLGLAGLALASGRLFRPLAGGTALVLALGIPLLTPDWDLYRMTTGISQLLRDRRKIGGVVDPASMVVGVNNPDIRVVFHREGQSSTVTVVREWSEYWLRVDGKTDASTTRTDMVTQVLLGQLPMFFAREPRDACVIGFGSGVTSHAVLTHPVRRLDNIEIERQVVEASSYFDPVSHRPLADPRSRLIIDDARTALAYRPQAYDVIISEPSNPWMAGVNNLFTREFYGLVRSRLRPGGIFCQWVQRYELSDDSLQVILDTFAASFPYPHLFASHLGGDMLLLASDRPLALVDGARELFPGRPEVAPDLARIDVGNLADLAVLYTAPLPPPSPVTLLNTDDNSIIQYRAALDLLRSIEPENLRATTSVDSLGALFYPGWGRAEVLVEMGRAAGRRKGVTTVEVIGGMLEGEGRSAEAAEMRGLAAGIRHQLELDAQVTAALTNARARVEATDPQGAGAWLREAERLGLSSAGQLSEAGLLLMNLGRYVDAEGYLDRAVALREPQYLYQSLAARGAVRFRLGRRDEGLADLQSAKALDPGSALAYLMYGLALFDAGEKEEAFRELHRGLEVVPGDHRILQAIGFLSSKPGPAPAPAPGSSPTPAAGPAAAPPSR